MKKARVEGAYDMSTLVKSISTTIASTDCWWKVDRHVLELLSGAGAEQRALRRVLAILPSKDVDRKPSAVLADLDKLMASKAGKLAPAGVTCTLKSVRKMLVAIDIETGIDAKLVSQSPMMAGIWPHFGHFLRSVPPHLAY